MSRAAQPAFPYLLPDARRSCLHLTLPLRGALVSCHMTAVSRTGACFLPTCRLGPTSVAVEVPCCGQRSDGQLSLPRMALHAPVCTGTATRRHAVLRSSQTEAALPVTQHVSSPVYHGWWPLLALLSIRLGGVPCGRSLPSSPGKSTGSSPLRSCRCGSLKLGLTPWAADGVSRAGVCSPINR